MADKIDWSDLPVALPGGALMPHLSARMRTREFDAVYQMIGSTEAFADWAAHNRTEFYKLWGRGAAKPISVEVSNEDSLEGMLAALDMGEHAKVISPDGSEVTIDDLVLKDVGGNSEG